MMRSLIFVLCFCAAALSASAAPAYDGELTRPTGTNWMFPGERVVFEVSDPNVAEILRDAKGELRVHLIRPGDVVVRAAFYDPGREPLVERYLFHVTGEPIDDTAVDWGTFAIDIIRLTNIEREKEGLPPLAPAFELSDAAAARAEEVSRVFSHTRPDGQPYHTVFEKGSYKAAGENLQAGASSPEACMDAWMHSPEHRKNILSDEFTALGVGYIYKPDSKYHHYWVQLFIR